MRIDSPSLKHLSELKSLWKEAFGDTEEFLDIFARTAFSPDRTRCVFENEKPVAALYWFNCSYSGMKIAYIYAVATDKAYRGRGICRALMDNTHKHLIRLGYCGAILVPGSEELFSFYRKIGYLTCSHIGEFCCEASQNAIAVREIGADEYVILRRGFISESGVLQENENIAFLREQAAFYTGDGFLLAARKHKNTLYGIELLGEGSVAPDILYTLGYKKGFFRTPGDDRPFAMYYALDDKNIAPPSYFGLAFD